MRNTTFFRNTLLGLSCLGAIAFTQSTTAQPTTPAMTSAEIEALVTNNTTIGTFSDRPLSYIVFVAADGRMIGRISDGTTDRIELGSWQVRDDMLCGRWDNLKNGEENCFSYHRVGDNVHAYNTDGSLDRIQFFAQGDPYNLQAASTQVETEIRQFIDDWGKAWSPEDNAPQYSRESLVPFYLQSDELLAFDFTDAESTTVYRGVENHHSTWEAFVRDYDYWTFTPVAESVKIYPQSANAAAATLLVDIYGRKPDATEFQANAHATLLLEKRDGNWVIVHENIWGPVNE